jgi:Fervidolysin N-terminal prodomain
MINGRRAAKSAEAEPGAATQGSHVTRRDRLCDNRVMRVIVGIANETESAAVADGLRREGAQSVRGPAKSLPDVLVAEFPEGDLARTVKRVAALPGVRYAEPDEMRSIAD